MDIHADLVYSHAGYDVISYVRLAFIEVRSSKKQPPTALGRILVVRRFAYPTNWWASCLL